jgi:DNA-binding NarL/FixJ family response regulator
MSPLPRDSRPPRDVPPATPDPPTPLHHADDHRITHEVHRWALRAAPDLRVVGEALDGPTAVRLAREREADVAIVDIALPDLDGIAVTRLIRNNGRGPRVLALSAHRERRLIRAMFEAGATGYVSKAGTLDDLVAAVRTVAAGGTHLGDPDAAVLDLASDEDPFSPRETETLRLIATGLSTKEIAARLGVSVKTVEVDRRRLLEQLRLAGTADLTRYAIAERIAPLHD